ncbi:hypothetical protein CEXT_327041 [Caerostris extrusa]|uniref:Uncharacterized protein n=1 Tax=Caerostris extrusa TaxID=172846 RepID=A0AAV4SSY2_CAEEX|nr:hypothetical protein CEXT_327041 [Caerostris extrusa]
MKCHRILRNKERIQISTKGVKLRDGRAEGSRNGKKDSQDRPERLSIQMNSDGLSIKRTCRTDPGKFQKRFEQAKCIPPRGKKGSVISWKTQLQCIARVSVTSLGVRGSVRTSTHVVLGKEHHHQISAQRCVDDIADVMSETLAHAEQMSHVLLTLGKKKYV